MSSSRATTRRSAEADGGPPAPGASPLVVRLVEGDIRDARASVLVVNHFNGLRPAGAAAALDRVLGGALERRAASGALNGRFGTTHFIPAATAPVAADAVLVVGLGDPETFNRERLPELGAAIVEACAALRLRDAATILHGTGGAGGGAEECGRMLVEGVLAATVAVENGDLLRELSIVVLDGEALDKAERGARAAACPADVHVYFERVKAPPGRDVRAPRARRPPVLRLGITRSGTNVKVTQITEGAMDWTSDIEFPTQLASDITGRVQDGILLADDAAERAQRMESIGSQLYTCFLGGAGPGVAELLRAAADGLVALRLDRSTVDLPWELLHHDDEFLCLTSGLARQIEIPAPARQSDVRRRRGPLRALVVGDPSRNLPGAAAEADEVAAALREQGADVTLHNRGVTFDAISAVLDAHDFDLLHYAGHATYDEMREERGGLIFEGGILTAEDLRSRHFLPRVVVANACNSAQTGGSAPLEGGGATRDLVSGLLCNGVRTVIGSMWRVDDAAALTFARALYEQLLGRQLVGAAVRAARRAVVDRHGRGEPAWAGYALFGAPDERVL